MIDLNKLAAELHAAAVEKGFWDVELAAHKHVAKLRSELGEVIQADRVGVMYEVERDGAKPEGVAAELADFVMMMLDWMQAAHPDAISILTDHPIIAPFRTGIFLRSPTVILVDSLYSAVETIRSGSHTSNDEFYFSMMLTVYGPAVWLEERGYDIWEIIRAKMEYNRSRPKLHGRAY